MRTWKAALLTFAFLALAAAAPSGCGGGSGHDEPATKTLLDLTVTVPAGGGSSTVFFRGDAARTIRITLTGPATAAPYGFLETPAGDGSYTPPNTGAGSVNQADVTLLVTGEFKLTVFDANNKGGDVHVFIYALT